MTNDALAGGERATASLPPGQRRIEGFPRFGTHLARPAPAVPADPVIHIGGALSPPLDVPLAILDTLPRQELCADFHCVTGWSATDLRWNGVAFDDFYRRVIEPALPPGTAITHVTFRGLDGFRSIVCIEDARAGDVLIADHLDGRPLDSDHGAPARLVSPAQYGYISTKHLCRIDVHTAKPKTSRWSLVGDVLIASHPRARVWEEERHGYLPGRSVRPVYRALKAPFIYLCALGSSKRRR